MKQLQTSNIWYNFNLNQPDPLDIRFRIATMLDLPPIEKRYAGLIFFVIELDKPYIFLNDLTTPQDLFGLVNSSNLFGVTSNDYSTLITTLNSTNPILGSLITVFPLSVTFIYTGAAWKYYSGEYKVTDNIQFESIPNSLRKIQALVIFNDNTKHIISDDLQLSDEVILLTQFPQTFNNNRYYKINGNLYYAISGVFYKIGENVKIITNKELVKGNNTITHNLNSSYISVLFWINDTSKIIRLTEYDQISMDEIAIKSSINVTGTILLTSIY